VIDFSHLHPIVFIGEEGHLNVEQWLINTENLLVAAGIPETDRVDVVRIQLMGVSHLWWLTEESHLPKPVTWKTFLEVFLAKFFPDITKI